MKRVYLSFGSNVGDRQAQIRKALEMFPSSGIEVRRVSSLYRTEPVDFRPQPWFVNCVAEVETDLTPLKLLRRLKALERALGRRAGISKGPRPIDIDILLYENVVVRSSVLTIPHSRLSERRFVLVPLRELGGQLRHPVTQQTVEGMLEHTCDESQVRKLKNAEG